MKASELKTASTVKRIVRIDEVVHPVSGLSLKALPHPVPPSLGRDKNCGVAPIRCQLIDAENILHSHPDIVKNNNIEIESCIQ